MSVVIRMQRAGGRNYPFFRVVVADSRRARDGRFLEKVGYYNPLSQPAQVELDQNRMQYWLQRGAQPSEAVAVLFKQYQRTRPATGEALAVTTAAASTPADVPAAAPAPAPVPAPAPPAVSAPAPPAVPEAAPAPETPPAASEGDAGAAPAGETAAGETPTA